MLTIIERPSFSRLRALDYTMRAEGNLILSDFGGRPGFETVTFLAEFSGADAGVLVLSLRQEMVEAYKLTSFEKRELLVSARNSLAMA